MCLNEREWDFKFQKDLSCKGHDLIILEAQQYTESYLQMHFKDAILADAWVVVTNFLQEGFLAAEHKLWWGEELSHFSTFSS